MYHQLQLLSLASSPPETKIKIEVDTEPPADFNTEEKLFLKPFPFYVNCFSLPDLFAGKMHALLFRKWGSRVKGRDWFDLEWYIKNGISLHLAHLQTRAKETGDWKSGVLNRDALLKLLKNKIHSVSFSSIREDITKFIPDATVLDIWSAKYFSVLVKNIKTIN